MHDRVECRTGGTVLTLQHPATIARRTSTGSPRRQRRSRWHSRSSELSRLLAVPACTTTSLTAPGPSATLSALCAVAPVVQDGRRCDPPPAAPHAIAFVPGCAAAATAAEVSGRAPARAYLPVSQEAIAPTGPMLHPAAGPESAASTPLAMAATYGAHRG